MFEDVALGVGGPDFYRKALVQLDASTINGPTMTKVLETFKKIHGYTDKNAPGRDWNLATAMVIKGEAGMQLMGDWAKGEFLAAGKKPGTEFVCSPAPSSAKDFTFNIDSFAMFELKNKANVPAQKDLAKAIMSPAFQELFNLNKGLLGRPKLYVQTRSATGWELSAAAPRSLRLSLNKLRPSQFPALAQACARDRSSLPQVSGALIARRFSTGSESSCMRPHRVIFSALVRRMR